MTRKMQVKQSEGEITFTPGGLGDPVTFKVEAGFIDVPDEMVEELSRHLDVPVLSQEERVKQAEQAGFDAEKKRQDDAKNAQAVADAAAAGAARAAKESSTPKGGKPA